MDAEPMFCFETSLKMLYFSMLVYRYEEVKMQHHGSAACNGCHMCTVPGAPS